jgi:alkylhydroperoxidase family enzyme
VAIRFAEKLTAWPASIHEPDLAELGKHFKAEQIVELVFIIGTANLTNRFNEGLRTPVDV